MLEDPGPYVLAAGALGTAAFGIVEGLKRWKAIGEAGADLLLEVLGPILATLKVAYGADAEQLLRGLYRGDRQDLKTLMRQGTRIGLTPANAAAIARSLGSIDPELIQAAALAVERGDDLPPPLRNVLGKFELAVDARIDAALALADDRYKRTALIAASFVALTIAVTVGLMKHMVLQSVLIGLVAVPLAPIAKDVATALKSAAEALRART